METVLYSNIEIVEEVEDLRGLFSVDAQFINLDNQFYLMNEKDEEVPFDRIVNEVGTSDLVKLAYALGQGLAEYDSDFIDYKINVIEVDNKIVVSYAVIVFEY